MLILIYLIVKFTKYYRIKLGIFAGVFRVLFDFLNTIMLNHVSQVCFLGVDGQSEIILETGLLARQADGAVLLKQGKCVMLATVCASKEPKPGQSFFPLSVDYMERFSSAGRIPGSFHRREGRLSDYEILVSRLVDRALRPLFPENYLCEVQIVITLLSSDPEILPDSLAALVASAALAVSDIPIGAMISEVRIGKIDGKYIVNPTRSQLRESSMDFIIAATEKDLLMVEGEAKECSEEELQEALVVAHEAIKLQIEAQRALCEKVGYRPKRSVPELVVNAELLEKVKNFASERILSIARSALSKLERSDSLKVLGSELLESLQQDFAENWTEEYETMAKKYYEDLQWELVRKVVLDEGRRLDGRGFDEVRPIQIAVDYLPSPHGCALFTRGETQALTTATLGTSLSDLLQENAHQSQYTKFILHYNFPAFSTGEIKPMRGPGRREIGHGNLALRSLKQMLPPDEANPFTIRVVSDILESNGSSSMATVCAGSLALMDAGVQMRKHVGGIAMGLISRSSDQKYAILTDILGDEDHLGDMDFKITGTRDGICGVQMDIKIDGLKKEVMAEALLAAKKARLSILDKMYLAMDSPRSEPKAHAPRIEKIIIASDQIGAVIGPQGKIIQDIQKKSGATVTVEEQGSQGNVFIFSSNNESLKIAKKMIQDILAVPTVGEVYDSVVKSVMPYGAFVEFLPKHQGLLHISQISWERLESLDNVLKEGDSIKVKLLEIDSKTGRFRLSHKVLLEKKS